MNSRVLSVDVVRAGRWMRLQRERRGLNQKQVALRGGVSTGAVYKWEAGIRFPSLDGFMAWAHALGLSPSQALADLEAAVAS